MGVNNENLRAKYAAALFESKELTWWHGMAGEHALDTLSWRDICIYLEYEFQHINCKSKLCQQIQGHRHTKTVQKYINSF